MKNRFEQNQIAMCPVQGSSETSKKALESKDREQNQI